MNVDEFDGSHVNIGSHIKLCDYEDGYDYDYLELAIYEIDPEIAKQELKAATDRGGKILLAKLIIDCAFEKLCSIYKGNTADENYRLFNTFIKEIKEIEDCLHYTKK